MSEMRVCWNCGERLRDVPAVIPRLAECAACHSYLHVCRMCVFYDPRASKACHEDDAEEITDKEHANFCEYFRSRSDAYRGGGRDSKTAARAQLDGLFGDKPQEAGDGDEARHQLEALFSRNKKDNK